MLLRTIFVAHGNENKIEEQCGDGVTAVAIFCESPITKARLAGWMLGLC